MNFIEILRTIESAFFHFLAMQGERIFLREMPFVRSNFSVPTGRRGAM